MSNPSAQERYQELAAKVDAMFERVAGRYGAAMRCFAGCTDCCASGLSVTLVEASAIAAELTLMSVEERRDLANGVRGALPGRCAALDGAGRCRIYEGRPLVCRSHGLPIRAPADGSSEPESTDLTTCEHNFVERPGLTEVDADCVLDQRTLSTVLGAIDMVFADEQGGRRGERILLADLLAEPSRYFDLPAD